MQLEQKQEFISTFDDDLVSAVIYDILQVQFKGLKAKTNFMYTQPQVLAILSIDCLMKYREVSPSQPTGAISGKRGRTSQ